MRIVQCPTCGKDVAWSRENKFRPFCSERCKLIDLGAWATGQNSISTPLTEKDLDDPNIEAQITKYFQEQAAKDVSDDDNQLPIKPLIK